MSETLRFRDVGVELGGRSVLRGVDFEVRAGEVVGLLGANGAGKTSLLRIATRTLAASAGEVSLAGRPIERLSRRALARAVAIVPQELRAPFPFRTGEIVLMGRTPHQPLMGLETRRDLDRAVAAMERMGIAQLADRFFSELSGGERQLALVARALTQEPQVLLLDEPTAFLDLRHRIDVLRAVRELAAAGAAALVVSHDLGLAARACDRLVLLKDGRVAAQGAPAEVLQPDVLQAAFGIRADVIDAPDGTQVVVPRV